MRIFQIMTVSCFVLSGCASQATTASSYVRTDGRPIDELQARAALAQCQGEGATAVVDYVPGDGVIPWATGVASRSSKETAVINACMARNGYVAQ